MEMKNYTLDELKSLRAVMSIGRYLSLARTSILDKNNPNREKAILFYQEREKESMDELNRSFVDTRDRPDISYLSEMDELFCGVQNTLEANIQVIRSQIK